ncbi:MAG TPA: J domain-containing protein [Stellaceae bacterium]|nr:J domain-containing protein [Stellaceae bacterium]
MAAKNPYEVLGVARDASEEDIRRAYRRLAKKHHPDLNPGNKAAEGRFKELNAANNIVADKEKRGRYDRGEIDEAGAEKPQYASANSSWRGFAEGAEGARYRAEGIDPENLDDLFSMFRRGGGSGGANLRMRGPDQQYVLTVDFLAALNGSKQRLGFAADKSLDVTIPPGTRDGQVLRLKGQGGAGIGGGPPGDALIEIHVAPHPFFRREGDDIVLELPVTIAEATLGGNVTVPTPSGDVAMNVPAGANAGTRLRLKGKGAPKSGGGRGDQYVTLKIVLPGTIDDELREFLRSWAPKHPDDPRRGLKA